MVTFVSKDETSEVNSVNALTGLAYPASGLTGDVLIGCWGSDSTQTATLDADFTAIENSSDGAARNLLFGRVQQAGDSGAISLSSGATANRQAAAICRYRDTSGWGATGTAASETSAGDLTHTSPNITPTVTGSGIVLFYVERVTSSALPITPPPGFQLRTSFATGGNGGIAVAIADKLSGNVAGTPVTPGDWTGTTSASAVRMYARELLPAGAVVNGVLSASLPAPVATLAGLRAAAASGLATLPAPVGTAAGLRTVNAQAAATLPGPVALLQGSRTVHGLAGALLPAPAAVLAGLREGHGSGLALLPAPIATLLAAVGGPALQLDLTGSVERGRWAGSIDPDRWTATVEPDPYTAEMP